MTEPKVDLDPLLVRLGLSNVATLTDDQLHRLLEPYSLGWCRMGPALFTPLQPVSMERSMPVLNKFEEIYQRFIKHRQLQVEEGADVKATLFHSNVDESTDITPPSVALVLVCLRFTCTIISHCTKVALFPSVKSCLCMLNADEPSIVISSLYWLTQFQHSSARIASFSQFQTKYSMKIRPYLVFLASGFYGGKRTHARKIVADKTLGEIDDLIGESEIVSLSVSKSEEELEHEAERHHHAFIAAYSFNRTQTPIPSDIVEEFPESLSLSFASDFYNQHQSRFRWTSIACYVRWLSQYYSFGPPHFYRLCHLLRFARSTKSLADRRLYVIMRLMSYQCLMSFQQMRKDLINYFEYLSDRFLEDIIALIRDEQRVPVEIRTQAWMTLSHFSSVSAVREALRSLGLASHAVVMTSLKASIASIKSYQNVIFESVRREEAYIQSALQGWPIMPSEPDHPLEVDTAASACAHAEAIFSYIERLIPRHNEHNSFEARMSSPELIEVLLDIVGDRDIRLGSLLMRAVSMIDSLLSVSPSAITRFHAVNGLDAFFDRVSHIVRFRVGDDDQLASLFVVAPSIDATPATLRKIIAPAAFLTNRTVLEKLISTSHNAVRAAATRAPIKAQFLKDGSFSQIVQHMWRQASGLGIPAIALQSDESSSSTDTPVKKQKTGVNTSVVTNVSKNVPKVAELLQPFSSSSYYPRDQLYGGRYRWGPEFFATVCNLVNIILSNHPPVLKQLHAEGCTATFVQLLEDASKALLAAPLGSESNSFLSQAAVVRIIPETLRSFCLLAEILEFILNSSAIKSLMSLFLAPAPVDLMVLDRALLYFLAKALDEMCRHNSALRPVFVTEIVAVLQALLEEAPVLTKEIEEEYRKRHLDDAFLSTSVLSNTLVSTSSASSSTSSIAQPTVTVATTAQSPATPWVLYSRRLIAIGRFLEMLNRFIPADLVKFGAPALLLKIALTRNRTPALAGLLEWPVHLPEVHSLLSNSAVSSSASIAAHAIVQAAAPANVITPEAKVLASDEKGEDKDRSANERANANEFNSFITPLLHMVKDPNALMGHVSKEFISNIHDLQKLMNEDGDMFLSYPAIMERSNAVIPSALLTGNEVTTSSTSIHYASPKTALRRLQETLCLLQSLDWTSLALARLTRRLGPSQFTDGQLLPAYHLLMDAQRRVHWIFAAHWTQQKLYEAYDKSSSALAEGSSFPASTSSPLLPVALYHQSLTRFLYHTIKLLQALIKLSKTSRTSASATDSSAKRRAVAQEKLAATLAKGLVSIIGTTTPPYIKCHWLNLEVTTPSRIQSLITVKNLRGTLRLCKLSLFSGSTHELNNDLFVAFRKEGGGDKVLTVLRWTLSYRIRMAQRLRAIRAGTASSTEATHKADAEIMAAALDDVLNEIGSLADQLSRYEQLPEAPSSNSQSNSPTTAVDVSGSASSSSVPRNSASSRHALHPAFETNPSESSSAEAANPSLLPAALDATSLDLGTRMLEESGVSPQAAPASNVSSLAVPVELSLGGNGSGPVFHLARGSRQIVEIDSNGIPTLASQSQQQSRTILSQLPTLPTYSPRTTIDTARTDATSSESASSPSASSPSASPSTTVANSNQLVRDSGVEKFSSLVARECWRVAPEVGGMLIAQAFDSLPAHFVTLMFNVTLRWSNKVARDYKLAEKAARLFFQRRAQQLFKDEAAFQSYSVNRLAWALEFTRSEDVDVLKARMDAQGEVDPVFDVNFAPTHPLTVACPSPRVAMFGDVDCVKEVARPMLLRVLTLPLTFIATLQPLQLAATTLTPPISSKLPPIHAMIGSTAGILCTLATFDAPKSTDSVAPVLADLASAATSANGSNPEMAAFDASMQEFAKSQMSSLAGQSTEFVRSQIVISVVEVLNLAVGVIDSRSQAAAEAFNLEEVELSIHQAHTIVHILYHIITSERKNADLAGDQMVSSIHHALQTAFNVQQRLAELPASVPTATTSTATPTSASVPMDTASADVPAHDASASTTATPLSAPPTNAALQSLVCSLMFVSVLLMEYHTNESVLESDLLPMLTLNSPLGVAHNLDAELPPQAEQFSLPVGYQRVEHQRELMRLALLLLPSPITHGSALPSLLDIIARLTRNRQMCDYFLSQGGLRLILNLPQTEKRSSTEPHIPPCSPFMENTSLSVVLSHCLTQPFSLQLAFEKEIIGILADNEGVISQSKHQYNRGLTFGRFLTLCTMLIKRDSALFARAVRRVAVLEQIMFEGWENTKPEPPGPMHRLRIRLKEGIDAQQPDTYPPASTALSNELPDIHSTPALQRSHSDRPASTPATKGTNRKHGSRSNSRAPDTASNREKKVELQYDWTRSENLVREAYKDFYDALSLDLVRGIKRVNLYTEKQRADQSNSNVASSSSASTHVSSQAADPVAPVAPASSSPTASKTAIGSRRRPRRGLIPATPAPVDVSTLPPITPLDPSFYPMLDHTTIIQAIQTSLQWENPDILPSLDAYDPSKCHGLSVKFTTLPSFLMQIVLNDPTQLFLNILSVTDFLIFWALNATAQEEKNEEPEQSTAADDDQSHADHPLAGSEADSVGGAPASAQTQTTQNKPKAENRARQSDSTTSVPQTPSKDAPKQPRVTVAKELIQLITGFMLIILTQPPPPSTLDPWFQYSKNTKQKRGNKRDSLMINSSTETWQTVNIPAQIRAHQLLQQITASRNWHRDRFQTDPNHILRFNQLLTAQSGLVQLLASLLSRASETISPFVRKRHVSWMIDYHAPSLITGLFQWLDLEPRSTHKVSLAIVTSAERALEVILKMNAQYGLDGQLPAPVRKSKKKVSSSEAWLNEALAEGLGVSEVEEGDEEEAHDESDISAILRQLADGDDDDEDMDDDDDDLLLGDDDDDDGDDIDVPDDEEGMIGEDDDDDEDDEDDEDEDEDDDHGVDDPDALPVGGLITVDEDDDEFGDDNDFDDDGDDEDGGGEEGIVVDGDEVDDDAEAISMSDMDDDDDDNEEDALIGDEFGIRIGADEPQPSASDSEAEAEAQEAARASTEALDQAMIEADVAEADAALAESIEYDDIVSPPGEVYGRLSRAREIDDEIEIDEADGFFDESAFGDDVHVETEFNRFQPRSNQNQNQNQMSQLPPQPHALISTRHNGYDFMTAVRFGSLPLPLSQLSTNQMPSSALTENTHFSQISDADFALLQQWSRQVLAATQRRGEPVSYGIAMFASAPSSQSVRTRAVVDPDAVRRTIAQYLRHVESIRSQPQAAGHPQAHSHVHPPPPMMNAHSHQHPHSHSMSRGHQHTIISTGHQGRPFDVSQLINGLVVHHQQRVGVDSSRNNQVAHAAIQAVLSSASRGNRNRRDTSQGIELSDVLPEEDQVGGGVGLVMDDERNVDISDGNFRVISHLISGQNDEEETDGSDEDNPTTSSRMRGTSSLSQRRRMVQILRPNSGDIQRGNELAAFFTGQPISAFANPPALGHRSSANHSHSHSNHSHSHHIRNFNDMRAQLEESWLEFSPVRALLHPTPQVPRPTQPISLSPAGFALMFRTLVRYMDMDALIHVRVRKAQKKDESAAVTGDAAVSDATSPAPGAPKLGPQSGPEASEEKEREQKEEEHEAEPTSIVVTAPSDSSSVAAVSSAVHDDEDDEDDDAQLRAALSLSLEQSATEPVSTDPSTSMTDLAIGGPAPEPSLTFPTAAEAAAQRTVAPPAPSAPDATVFAELPDDIQREILSDYRRQLSNYARAVGAQPPAANGDEPVPPTGVDMTFWNSLPSHLRCALTGTAVRSNLDASASEADPATVLHTLSQEAREDFMLNMNDDQLSSLPAALLAEALALRNRGAAAAYQRFGINRRVMHPHAQVSLGINEMQNIMQRREERAADNPPIALADVRNPDVPVRRAPAAAAPSVVSVPAVGTFPPELDYATLASQAGGPVRPGGPPGPDDDGDDDDNNMDDDDNSQPSDGNHDGHLVRRRPSSPAAIDISQFSSTDELELQRPGHSLLSMPFLMPLIRVLYMTPVVDTQMQTLQKVAQHLIHHQGTRHALLSFLTAVLRTSYLAPIAEANPVQALVIMRVTEKVEPEIQSLVAALPSEALGRAEESQGGISDDNPLVHPLPSLVVLRIIDFIRFLCSKLPYLVTTHFFKPAAASALAIKLAAAYDANNQLVSSTSHNSSSAASTSTPTKPPSGKSQAKGKKSRAGRRSRTWEDEKSETVEHTTPKKRAKRSHSKEQSEAQTSETQPVTPSTALTAVAENKALSVSQVKPNKAGGMAPILEFFAMLRSPEVCESAQSMYYLIRVLADLVELPLKHISEAQAMRARALKRKEKDGSIDVPDLTRPAHLDIPLAGIPVLPAWCAHALLMTMTAPGYSDRHMELATKVLLFFAEIEENAKTIVHEIGVVALETAKSIESDLRELSQMERIRTRAGKLDINSSIANADIEAARRKRRSTAMDDSSSSSSQSQSTNQTNNQSSTASASPFSNPLCWHAIQSENALLCFVKLLNTFNLIDGHSSDSASPRSNQSQPSTTSSTSAFVRLPNSLPAPTLLTAERVESGRAILAELNLFPQLRQLWQSLDDYFTIVEDNDEGDIAGLAPSVPSTPSARKLATDTVVAGGKDESVQAKVKSLLDKKAVDDRRHDLTEEDHTEKESDLQLLMHLPLLESLFIICAPRSSTTTPASSLQRQTTAENNAPISPLTLARASSTSSVASQGVAAPMSADYAFYFSFAARHRRVLNVCCRSQPHLLKHGSGALHSLVWHPNKVLDFDIRRKYFRGEMKRLASSQRQHPGQGIRLAIRRNLIFEDSYAQLERVDIKDWKNKLTIRFFGEEGLDAGGLLREWYLFLSRAVFNPDYALFEACPANPAIFQPNKSSAINSEHLRFFKFVGRLVGKALHDGQRLDAYFTRSFLKHMLNIPVNFHDLESVDPSYYNNLVWMLKNDIEGVIDETFSASVEEFGHERVVDLIPNGRSIAVTNQNKVDYVNALAEFRLTRSIASQISAFLSGFNELIPADLISIFNEHELELLLCGLPSIDLHDLASHIDYKGFTPHDQEIQWFWTILHEMTPQEKALLMLFVTGTSKIPLEGFKALQGANGITPFTVQKTDKPIDSLPEAHTCFNVLDLPVYSSLDTMRHRLHTAIKEGSQGFGFR